MGALLESLSSYDTNIMLGAIIFLLLVIFFVVLLHVYAKWFLSRARHLRRAPHLPVVTHLNVLPPPSSSSRSYTTSSKGVEASAIASIPLFKYTKPARDEDEECVICLSWFQEGEAGRRLVRCGHGFHVACIDMWLRSNSTCPVCRAPPVLGKEHDPVGAVVEEEAALVLEEVVVEENASSNNNITSSSASSILSVPNNINNNSSSSSSLGSSLKRMLSRNRSESSKVFPSISVNAAAADQLNVNS